MIPQIILLFLLGCTLLLYIPLNRQSPKFKLKLALDDQLPFVPWTVWIYASYYPLIPFTIAILWSSSQINLLLIALIISSLFSSLTWKIFPNGVSRPVITDTNTFNLKFLKLIYQHDKDCNGFPSGHVTHAFISCYFLAASFSQYWFLCYFIFIAISLSTLTTKQHYFFDMITTMTATFIALQLLPLVDLIIAV